MSIKIDKTIFDKNEKLYQEQKRIADMEYLKRQKEWEIKEEKRQKEELLKAKEFLLARKEEFKFTDKILNLKSSDFNECGIAPLTTFSYGLDHNDQELLLNFRRVLTHDYEYCKYNLVDELDPKADLRFWWSWHGDILSVDYYHPEMDKKEYSFFGKYGRYSKIKKLLDKIW